LNGSPEISIHDTNGIAHGLRKNLTVGLVLLSCPDLNVAITADAHSGSVIKLLVLEPG
jgi:tRNA pseudouridine-54 N-methylase